MTPASQGRPEKGRPPEPREPAGTLAALLEQSRPFTLAAPALGFASGAAVAAGAGAEADGAVLLHASLGTAMAVVLNAASNSLNQIYDVEIDRVNKPGRPLAAGRLTLGEAWAFTAAGYAVALLLAWLVAPDGRHECFWIASIAAGLTVAYSVPPLRTKRFAILSNLTVAVARGLLLKVAGWSAVRTIADPEPWYIGAVFALFLVGATTTKDFSDVAGDVKGGCRTLPVVYGPRTAARMIAPFFVFPFLMIAAGAWWGLLSGDPWLLSLLAVGLAAYGTYVAALMLRNPQELARHENHPSWTHMYLMLLVAQVGLAAAYLVRP